MELAPGEHIDGLLVETKLGSSRIGALYSARSVEDGRRCLVRVMEPGPPEPEADLLEARLAAISDISHPSLARPARWFRHRDLFAVVYDLPDSLPLDVALAGESLTPEQALEIVGSLAEGLLACHSRGVAHGNLTPASILLSPGLQPRVVDVGVFAPGHIRTGGGWYADLFDPRYASPEQLATGEVDAGADIFALGLLLLELCVGHLSWRDSDSPSPRQQQTGTVEIPRARPSVPIEIEKAHRRATDPDPAVRHRTLQQFLDDLRVAGFGIDDTTAIERPSAVDEMDGPLWTRARPVGQTSEDDGTQPIARPPKPDTEELPSPTGLPADMDFDFDALRRELAVDVDEPEPAGRVGAAEPELEDLHQAPPAADRLEPVFDAPRVRSGRGGGRVKLPGRLGGRRWTRPLAMFGVLVVVAIGAMVYVLGTSRTIETLVPVSVRVIREAPWLERAMGWPGESATGILPLEETGKVNTRDTGIVIATFIDGSMARLEPGSRLTIERSARVVEQPGPLAPMLARLLGQEEPRAKVVLELHSRLHEGEVLVRVPPAAAAEGLAREFLLMAEGAVARVKGTQFGARMEPGKGVSWWVDDGLILLSYVGTEIEPSPSGGQTQRTVAYLFMLGTGNRATTAPWPRRFADDEGRQRVFVEYMRGIIKRSMAAGRLDVDSRDAPLLRYDVEKGIAVYDLSKALVAPIPTPRRGPTLPPGIPTVTPTPDLPRTPTATPDPYATPSPTPTDIIGMPVIIGTPPTWPPTPAPGPYGTIYPWGTPTPGGSGWSGTPTPTGFEDPFAVGYPAWATPMAIDANMVQQRLSNLTWNDLMAIQKLPPPLNDPEIVRTTDVTFLTGAVAEVRVPRLGLNVTLPLRVSEGELRVGGLDRLGLSDESVAPWLGSVNRDLEFIEIVGSSGMLNVVYGKRQ